MKYAKPFKSAKPVDMTQGFWKEHQANDFASSYGTFITAPFNAKVINVVGAKTFDGSNDLLQNGCGVRLQSIEDPSITISYWHCLPFFPVSKGDIVIQGQPIAQMGNTGFVMAGDKIVETNMKLIPPYKGTHVHITMGKTNSDGTYTSMDYSKQIDWLIPVNYDALTAIKVILQKISNVLLLR